MIPIEIVPPADVPLGVVVVVVAVLPHAAKTPASRAEIITTFPIRLNISLTEFPLHSSLVKPAD
jgi:hypothetical protein